MCSRPDRPKSPPTDGVNGTIVVVGNELLDGSVTDANGQWVGALLNSKGVRVTEMRFVPDEVTPIANAIAAHLSMPQCRIVVVVGGLGPTPDDVTYEAVAQALGVPLEASEVMAKWVKGWWPSWAAESDEARRALFTMAELPRGARVASAPDGSGPLAYMEAGGQGADQVRVLMLPGVPRYVRHLMTDVAVPQGLLPEAHIDETHDLPHEVPEHRLSSVLSKVGKDFPSLKVGSYTEGGARIHLSGAKHFVKAATNDLNQRLHGNAPSRRSPK